MGCLYVVPPIISRAPQPETVEEDSSVELSCQVVGTQYPVTRITWSKDGVALPLVSSAPVLQTYLLSV